MTTRSVDTAKWNLFGPIAHAVPMILVAACGPVLGGEGESSDTDPTNPTDPTDPTDPTESTDPTVPPPECVTSSDCDYGYYCNAGMCEYEYCSRLPPGYDVRCSPPPDCYDDSECDPGYVCDYGGCRPSPSCGVVPTITQAYDIAFSGGAGDVGALAFDPTLVVARGAVVERVSGTQGTVVAEASAAIRTIALGDVDGDDIGDLLVVTDGIGGELRLWHGDGDGFTVTEFAQPIGGMSVELGIGDREGDGLPDVFARAGGDIVVFPGGVDAPLGTAELLVGGEVSAFTMLDPSLPDAFVYAAGPLLRLVDGAGNVDLALAQSSSLSRIAVGAFTQPGVLDVIAHGGSPLGYIEVFDVLGAQAVTSDILDVPRDLVAVGDADGDGLDDVALSYAGSTVVRIQYGASLDPNGGLFPEGGSPFGCESSFDLGVVVRHMGLVDVDGDGYADLVVSDGTRVNVNTLAVYLE